MDIAEDVWADEDAIYVVGSIEENTTTSKLMLSKFIQNIHMQREQIWSVNWSSNSATYGKGIWSNGTEIFTIGEYYNNFVLIKWNIDGTEIWNSTWNLKGEFGRVHSVWGISNEIYVSGVYIDDLVLIKWNNEGTEIWNRTWGGLGWEEGFDVWGSGNDIYTCGSTSSYGAKSNDTLIIRWNSDGIRIWNKTWSRVNEEYLTSIYGNGDDLYVCGSKWNTNELSTDVLIMKWYTNGTLHWYKVTGEEYNDIGTSIWANDYHVYIGGTTFEKGRNDDEFEEEGDQLILKYSYSGVREEKLTWGYSNSNESCNGIYVSNDNLYTVGTYGPHQSHYIIRYYSYNHIQPPDLLQITPNPSLNGSFFLEWEEVTGADYYNLYKDIHPILDISHRTPYQSLMTTNITEVVLLEGTYFYVLTTVMKGAESVISLPRIVNVDFPEPPKNISGYNVLILFALIVFSVIWLSIQQKGKKTTQT
ncbi:MAG: hypothetical protein EU530_07165 [Promethearchaeota archaeon]|nr:MAG: hypothetical protein EU530_07165 [Candidatus Lokiarchaeota archaeon]